MSLDAAAVTQSVCEFYTALPFNYTRDVDETVQLVQGNPLLAYPDLVGLLESGRAPRLVEFGCGCGWLSASAAWHYDVDTHGIDLTPRAIERARAVARRLGIEDRTRFDVGDLLTIDPIRAPLVVSIGVLHHTFSTEIALARIARSVEDGGSLYVGLYHEPGRKQFLRLMRDETARGGEAAALATFARLVGRPPDDTFTQSWFRDQVLHPVESLHTLRETVAWLDALGFFVESSSVNHFARFDDVAGLYALEDEYAALSLRRNRDDGVFFPGFFTVLARRRP